LYGFTVSTAASAVRTSIKCGKANVESALLSGLFSSAGGIIGRYSGLLVPTNRVKIERGYFGSLAEKWGIIGAKLKDTNQAYRTRIETGVGVTTENILSGEFVSSKCGCN